MADHNFEQYLSIEPEFVLANPYSFPITGAGGGMSLGFRINTDNSSTTYPAGWEWTADLQSRNNTNTHGQTIALGSSNDQTLYIGHSTADFYSTAGGSNVRAGYYPMVKNPINYSSGISGGFNSALDNISFHIVQTDSNFAPGEAKVFTLNPIVQITVTVASGYNALEGKVVGVVGGAGTTGSSAIANGSITPVLLSPVQPLYVPSTGLPSPYYILRDTGIATYPGKIAANPFDGNIANQMPTPVNGSIDFAWPGTKWGYLSTLNPAPSFTLELRSDLKEPPVTVNTFGINSDTYTGTTSSANSTVNTGFSGPGQNVLQSIINMDLTGAGNVDGRNTAALEPVQYGYNPPYAIHDGYRRQYLGTNDAAKGSMPVFLSSYIHMLALPGNLGEFPAATQSGSPQVLVGFWTDLGTGTDATTKPPEGWFDPSQYLAFSIYKDYNLRATNMALPPFAAFNNPWANTSLNPVYNRYTNRIQNYFTTPPYGRVFDEGPGNDDNVVTGQEDVTFSQNALGKSLYNNVGFTNQDDAAWGYSNSAKGNGQQFVALYSLPQKGGSNSEAYQAANGTTVTIPDVPMMSLGQLTHADFTQDDIWCSVGYQPGNAFGNSYFTPYVTRGSVIQSHPNLSAKKVMLTVSPQTWLGGGTSPSPFNLPTTINAYDISYLMNVALWDRYFFSTLVPTVSPTPANSRMAFAAGYSATAAQAAMQTGLSVTDPVTGKTMFQAYVPARYLMVDGAFNVNSTSFEAWRSVLSALRGVPYNRNASGIGNGGSVSYYPRTMASTTLTTEASSGTTVNSPVNDGYQSGSFGTNGVAGAKDPTTYAGFRSLTDDQIDILAAKIVQQVHQRGPFLSLAQFVNRTLLYPYNGGSAIPANLFYTVSGPLQAAIDMCTGAKFPSFNSFIAGGGTSNAPSDTNPGLFIPWTSGAATASSNANQIFPDAGLFGPGIRPYSRFDSQAGRPSANPNSVLTGIPGWLTQADLLQVLAPILAARSDTFVIRSYGEVLNPAINQANLQYPPSNLINPIVSDPSSVLSRAWCELVVQRMPDYVATDPKSMDDPSATTGYGAPNPSANTGGTLHPVNAYFGRRFRIVSIRWLSADEI